MVEIGSAIRESYLRRVFRALDRRRLGAVVLVTLLLSAEALSSADLLSFFSPVEIALAWGEHFLELAILAATLTIAYTLIDEALEPRPSHVRLALTCGSLFALSPVLTLGLHAYYAHGFEHLPPPLRLLADSLRLGLPAIFLVVIADVHHRALQVVSAAHAAETKRSQLMHAETEQQLALLQAQIEPHFLFNVLGNVRRLYRTQPQAGSDAIVSLMRYLRAALPQLRSPNATLQAELQLVAAYLNLLRVRMGSRLSFSIDVDPSLDDLEFPAMLAMTLVENAVKHGLEPVGGGSIIVRADRLGESLQLAVLDDGAGFGATATSGTGVGLANLRRQLVARYGRQARLTLKSLEPRGTAATISIPIRSGNVALNRGQHDATATQPEAMR